MFPLTRDAGCLLFILLALVHTCSADYYIDDTNTTLTYSSGPKAAWGPFAAGGESLELLLPNNTYMTIDPFQCYNHTYRYAACYSSDDCILTIPFTGKNSLVLLYGNADPLQGSGITIFVYQSGPVGINASITVDESFSQTNVLDAPPAPWYDIANVTMFDVQELVSGPHTVLLTVNDLFGSYSGMMWDYAYINETLVTTPPVTTTTGILTTVTSSSSAVTSVSTISSTQASSGSHSSLGAIVGGAVGGLALVVIGIIAALCLRRRRSRSFAPVDVTAGESPRPFNPSTLYDPEVSQVVQPAHTADTNASTITSNSTSPSAMLLTPNRRPPSDHGARMSTVTPFTSSASNPSERSSSKTPLVVSNISSPPSLGQLSPNDARPSQASSRVIPQSLTDEQADFITALYNNNVPAAAVARVVERMLADRHAGVQEWETELSLSRTHSMALTAPPSYDSVNPS
ncbi:hypothetical protein ID866_7111 [Astraeus odoratus]|nr:hypothetical protein ID866_7111 [Astraeus odoratus]